MSVAVRATLQAVVIVIALGAILFGIAGRFDWGGAWLLIVFYAFFLAATLVWAIRNAPDLIKERSRIAPNAKRWDKVILLLNGILLLALLSVAALDAGRYRWSTMPMAMTLIGVAVAALSGMVISWTLVSNPFLSRVARIQDDRQQTVVTTGPYRFVRHPMYAALIVLMFAIALILGSRYALIPAAAIAVLYVVRTSLEDRMLRKELAGYADYAARVRYRLIPLVW